MVYSKWARAFLSISVLLMLYTILFGANVNLGNIAPNDMIPLECLRLGLRGDTFFDFLPQDYADRLKQVNDENEVVDETEE